MRNPSKIYKCWSKDLMYKMSPVYHLQLYKRGEVLLSKEINAFTKKGQSFAPRFVVLNLYLHTKNQ